MFKSETFVQNAFQMTTSLRIFEQSGQSILANGKPRISPVFQYCAVTVLFCLVHGSAISLMSSSAAVNQVFFFFFFFIVADELIIETKRPHCEVKIMRPTNVRG